MPKRTDIKRIMVVGSGPIVIGQACEFDYSGTQAARSLREEGIKVSLINDNPATIMTDPMTAEHVYMLPLTVASLRQILEEHADIDAVLSTMGGQTALNLTITPDGGAPVTLTPGDAFAVEPDFKGTWTIEEPVRKHFAIKLK